MKESRFRSVLFVAIAIVVLWLIFMLYVFLSPAALPIAGSIHVAHAQDVCDSCELPAIDDVCFSVTNYWPFDDDLQIQAYGGQADGDPFYTAGMVAVSPDREFDWVAAPLSLLNEHAKIKLPWIDDPLPVWDTFGNPEYQSGVFWHDGYGRYVIGVDVFTATPIHYLECDGEIIYPD